MVTNRWAAVLLSVCIVACAPRPVVLGQQQTDSSLTPEGRQAQGSARRESDATGDVVQLSSTLVQVDAIVRNKKGAPITDLGPSDFEVFEDGRPQTITNFSYVRLATPGVSMPGVSTPDASTPGASKASGPASRVSGPPIPAVPVRPGDVRRTLALVVDDLSLSAERAESVRFALRKFVDEQMQPGDLVAIVRTEGGMGALQQFTSDKRLLYAAIKRVRWNPSGKLGANSFTLPPAGIETRPSGSGSGAPEGSPGATDPIVAAREKDREAVSRRNAVFTFGTLGALDFILRGLERLPGRKSVVLFSEGFSIHRSDDRAVRSEAVDALRQVVDRANRAAVALYTVDVRGVVMAGFASAEFGTDSTSSDSLLDRLAAQRDRYLDSQEPLNYLAEETGGLMVASNDTNLGVRRALEDQAGYYAIGYMPDDETYKRRPDGAPVFHRIEVRVKGRDDLDVRSRSGFYGVTDAERAAAASADPIVDAIASPFAAGDVALRLTSQFMTDGAGGLSVRSLLHVDARDLTFVETDKGLRSATIRLLALAFGDNGTIASKAERTQTVVVPEARLERLRSEGVVFAMNLPVKGPGALQVRAAVVDGASQRVGAAYQFVEVPNLGDGRLALSGLVLGAADAKPVGGEATKGPAGDVDTSAVVRRFRPGSGIGYAFVVYNAKVAESRGARPDLDIEVAVWRDGRRVFAKPAERLALSDQPRWNRINVVGSVRLAAKAPAASYVLEVTIRDRSTRDAVATQWIDFDVAA